MVSLGKTGGSDQDNVLTHPPRKVPSMAGDIAALRQPMADANKALNLGLIPLPYGHVTFLHSIRLFPERSVGFMVSSVLEW